MSLRAEDDKTDNPEATNIENTIRPVFSFYYNLFYCVIWSESNKIYNRIEQSRPVSGS